MTNKKDPKFIGVPEGPDSVVSNYREGVKARAEAARKARPKVGDLLEANALYDPKTSPPMTISQVAEGARRMNEAVEAEEQPRSPGLSDGTIAGLRELAEKSKAMKEEQQMQQEQEPAQMPERPAVDREEEAEDTPRDVKRQMAADTLSSLDDLEFERLMTGIQQDVINNTEQREAIEKLVPEFDLARCLGTGDWSQVVPVVPGKLDVTFRLVTPFENQALRLLLFDWIDKDPRLEAVHGDIYSLMMIVASVVRIGNTELPPHLVQTSDSLMSTEFDERGFTMKYNTVRQYPNPFIHMLGVHSHWFDMRAREAMRVTNLKSG